MSDMFDFVRCLLVCALFGLFWVYLGIGVARVTLVTYVVCGFVNSWFVSLLACYGGVFGYLFWMFGWVDAFA